MAEFNYILDKIRDAEYQTDPFRFVYIEDFLSDEHFEMLTKDSQIDLKEFDSTEQMVEVLQAKGYKPVPFPGCTTNVKEYVGVNELQYTTLKIQKTLPKQGYHIWHVEHGPTYDNMKRVLAFTIYLNDIEEGGETEFLNQSIRVKPKTGRIVIWPAGFPYVHRGNPPLEGEKYILTSWLLLQDI